MIRFKCPACQKVLKVLDKGAGREISCPKCGQRMRVPAPAEPAAINPTVSGQLTPSSQHGPTPSLYADSDSLVLLGLRKDSETTGEGGEQSVYKPSRSWAGTVCALLALILAIAAMPAAVIHHPLLGAGLAGLGLLFGAFGLFIALLRRGAGCGLSLAGSAVCGSILFAAITLFSKDAAPNDRRTQTVAAKQGEKDTETKPEEPPASQADEAGRAEKHYVPKAEFERVVHSAKGRQEIIKKLGRPDVSWPENLGQLAESRGSVGWETWGYDNYVIDPVSQRPYGRALIRFVMGGGGVYTVEYVPILKRN